MPRKERARIWFGFAGLAVVLAALFIWNLNAGSVSISVREIVSNLFGDEGGSSVIVRNIRLPRIFAAILLGGALALSGFLLPYMLIPQLRSFVWVITKMKCFRRVPAKGR